MYQLVQRRGVQGRFVIPPFALRGMGDGEQEGPSTGTQVAGAAVAGAAQIAAIWKSNLQTGTKIFATAGTSLLTAAPFTGPAAPFVAAAGAVVELLASMGVGAGCGQSCVLSSEYADKAENILSQNILTYFSLPAPRSATAQAAALRIFDAVWADLSQQCSNPALKEAGQRCITDRQRGACKWKQTSDSILLNIPGEPQPGECWNWFSGYRDPIANDPAVADAASEGGILGTLMSGNGTIYLIGAAALLGLAMMGESN